MKINENKYWGLRLNHRWEYSVENFYQEMVKSLPPESTLKVFGHLMGKTESDDFNDEEQRAITEIRWFGWHLLDKKLVVNDDFVVPENENYILTKSAFDLATTCKVDESTFDLKCFEQLPMKKATILVGKDKAIRWMRINNRLYVCIHNFETEKQSSVTRTKGAPDEIMKKLIEEGFDANETYTTEFSNNEMIHHNYEWFFAHFEKGKHYVQFDRPDIVLAVQLISFIELGETEVRMVKGKSRIGKTRKDKVINESGVDVRLVDSTWNEILVRGEAFAVRPHMAWRRCGKDRQDRVYTFIKGYMKKGVTRRRNKN